MGSGGTGKEKHGGHLFHKGLERTAEKVEKSFEKGIGKLLTGHAVDPFRRKRSGGSSSSREEEAVLRDDGVTDDPVKKKKEKFRMPPDPTLQKMKIIAERKLKGVSVQDYYQVAWSDKTPMYGPFLEKQGKNNVTVREWESGSFEGEWCKETYAEKRIVTFSFMKQTIGQTLVEVKHTQQYRGTNNDQCIVQIKMEMKGFPYADCFVVMVRHVASRVGDHDLSIQIGMHVNFLKSCMFEKKIRTNTGAETTKAQLALLEMILEGCIPYAKEVDGAADESEDEDGTLERALAAGASETAARFPVELPDPIFKAVRFVMMAFVTLFRAYLRPYIQPELFHPFPYSSMDEALQSTRASLKALEEISLKSAADGLKEDVTREIALIGESIERIEKISLNSVRS